MSVGRWMAILVLTGILGAWTTGCTNNESSNGSDTRSQPTADEAQSQTQDAGSESKPEPEPESGSGTY